MSERIIGRIRCSRGTHVVGKVVATANGYRLHICSAVETGGHPFGVERSFGPDLSEMGSAFCSVCERRLPMVPAELIDRVLAGENKITLDAEGMWRDPLGVLRRQDRPPAQ